MSDSGPMHFAELCQENYDLRWRVAKLEAALKKIANRSPWTNFDGQSRKDYPKGVDGLADYWSGVANGSREIALAALKDAPSEPLGPL